MFIIVTFLSFIQTLITNTHDVPNSNRQLVILESAENIMSIGPNLPVPKKSPLKKFFVRVLESLNSVILVKNRVIVFI